MSVSVACRVFPILLSSFLAVGLSDLFQKAKNEFRTGSFAAALETLEKLEGESLQPGHEPQRAALRPGLLFYKAACLASLGRQDEAQRVFEEFLTDQPNVRLDPGVYSRSVIAAFERAREARGQGAHDAAEGPTLAEAYRTFPRPEIGKAEKPGEEWADGPVRHLLSPEDRRNFSRLSDPISRSEFVTSFWRARDPKPETDENELRREFEKRVAFADARFTQQEVRGSLTDRGMVFILLGPPTSSGRKPLRTGDDVADASGLSRFTRSETRAAAQPGGSNSDRQARIEQVTGPGSTIGGAAANWVEVWHYLRENLPKSIPYQEVIFEFVTKEGYGRNVLQRNAATLTTLSRAVGPS
jgi:GWxTD domain-containing protein